MSIFRRFTSGGDKASSTAALVDSDSPTKFTLPHLRNLHKVLVENKTVTEENESLVVEVLRVLAEMVVYGDSKSELLFDFFCEKNMLALFLEIMRSPTCPGKVYVQILQTLSILCQCVRNDTSLYYLLSNNYVNDIIRFPYDFDMDELSDIFLSFMKSLSLRLNRQSVQFFFIEESKSFPLLSRAIEFLKYRDPMVRTGAQSTILNIFKIEDEKARRYSLDDLVLSSFAAEVTGQLEAHRNSILELAIEYSTYTSQPHTNFTDGKMGERIENQINSSVDALEDWLYYLEDVYGLRIPKLTNILCDRIMQYYVYPALLEPMLRSKLGISSTLYVSSGTTSASKGKSGSQSSASGTTILDPNSTAAAAMSAAVNSNPELLSVSDMMNVGATPPPEEDGNTGRDEAAVSIAVSLYLIMQMFRTVKEKRLRRSLSVALFHPFSKTHRLKCIEHLRNGDGLVVTDAAALTGNSGIPGTPSSSSDQRSSGNPFRTVLIELMQSGKDRFSMMACLVVENFIRQDLTACASYLQSQSVLEDSEDIEATKSVVELFDMLSMWQIDRSGRGVDREDPEVAFDARSLLAQCTNEEMPGSGSRLSEAHLSPPNEDVVDTITSGSPNGNDLMGDLDAEVELEAQPQGDISPEDVVKPTLTTDSEEAKEAATEGLVRDDEDGGVQNLESAATVETELGDAPKKDYKVEMEEYTYGAAESEQIAMRDRGGSIDLESGPQTGDALAVSAMSSIAVCSKDAVFMTGNEKAPSGALLSGLFAILNNAPLYSLAVLQVTAVIIYDMMRLYHCAHRARSSTDDWTCPDILIASLEEIREATKSAAAALLSRANGWLSDTLLSQLEEELRRAAASNAKWETTLQRVSSDILLLLPPSAHLFQRIGTDHSIPISEVEKARREIQIFSLLRSLYMCILRLATSSTATTTPGDIAKGILHSSLSQFGEYSDVAEEFTVGKTIAMGGRHCFASCVLLPAFDPTDFAKTGKIADLSALSEHSPPPLTPGSRRGSSSPSKSPKKVSSLRRVSLGLTSSSPPPAIQDTPGKTPERPRKVGEVYFIYDEMKTLLLSVPLKRLDSGVVLLAVPIHRVDVATDSEDERNIKLLTKSSQVLPTMDRVALSDSTGSTGNYSPSTHGDSGPKIASILPIRCPGVLYQMIIGFESKKHCDAAVRHIETSRMRVKSARMDLLRSILQKWSIGDKLRPDE